MELCGQPVTTNSKGLESLAVLNKCVLVLVIGPLNAFMGPPICDSIGGGGEGIFVRKKIPLIGGTVQIITGGVEELLGLLSKSATQLRETLKSD